MTRVLALTERRPRAVKLPRREVEFLLSFARDLIDVAPTFERGTYSLTPRGSVGFLDGPITRYLIRPKIPWPNLAFLLGLTTHPAGSGREPEGGLLAALATAFADRFDELARSGLVAGYGERAAVSQYLRGRLRTADQLRDAAAQAFPGHFHIDEPTFDIDTPWNRVAKATAVALAARPGLPASLRDRVAAATQPLATVAEVPFSEADLRAARADPRAAGYGPLLDVCGTIQRGLAAADPLRAGTGGFLLDLGAVFERYLASALSRAFATRPGWAVEPHPVLPLGPLRLQPDLVLSRRGAARVVLDAKWKTSALDPADVHQVLAYATLTGAPRVVLVYPGCSDARASFLTPDGRVRVTRYRLRVVGTAADLASSAARLARDVRRR